VIETFGAGFEFLIAFIMLAIAVYLWSEKHRLLWIPAFFVFCLAAFCGMDILLDFTGTW
jgi:hypothetical protein